VGKKGTVKPQNFCFSFLCEHFELSLPNIISPEYNSDSIHLIPYIAPYSSSTTQLIESDAEVVELLPKRRKLHDEPVPQTHIDNSLIYDGDDENTEVEEESTSLTSSGSFLFLDDDSTTSEEGDEPSEAELTAASALQWLKAPSSIQ